MSDYTVFFCSAIRRAVDQHAQTTGPFSSPRGGNRKAQALPHVPQRTDKERLKDQRAPALLCRLIQALILEKELLQEMMSYPSGIRWQAHSLCRFSCCRWDHGKEFGSILTSVQYIDLSVFVIGWPCCWWRLGFPVEFTDLMFALSAHCGSACQHPTGSYNY